jgi:predicted RND superfamily exporter protein
VLLLVLATTPVLAYGVREGMRGGNNDVRQWLPAGFQETQDYDWFVSQFGSEEMALVSWPGATLDDERLDRLAAGLAPYVAADATVGPEGEASATPLFSHVLTSRQALDDLTGEPMNLSREEAIARLKGTLLGPDGQTAGMMVIVSEHGAADRHAALEVIYQTAEDYAGLTRDDIRMGGPTVESVALDVESERARYMLAVISVFVALAVAWWCLKQVRLVLIVFATALYCTALGVAIVHFTGGTMNVLLVMMPTLIYVLTISAGVHLANYYRDALAHGTPEQAPQNALKVGWLPCALSAATTAIGLASLAISEVIPVRMFGIYSALGLLASVPILLLCVPAGLQLWPVRRAEMADDDMVPEVPPGRAAAMAAWVGRRHRSITVVGLVAMAVAAVGVTQVETSVDLLNLFSPEARIIRDYQWLEQHLGPLVPVEVVVRFRTNESIGMVERMLLVEQIEQALDAMPAVGGTMSAATFAPPLPLGAGILQRRAFDRRLEQHRDYFIGVQYLQEAGDAELWRVSARVAALDGPDYGRFIDDVVERVEPILTEYAQASGEQVDAVYTGIVPLVYKAQRTLLNDLMTSFATAFVIVGCVMIVLLRSVTAGLVAMIPSIFPALIAFGAMGHVGRLVDIGSMMTAAVALGIAVDDTIHFLSWFRRGLAQRLSRWHAISLAYQRCAGAMSQTTLICGLGLLVFAFSGFVPTSRFAWLMATMLALALVGDLLLLPALLSGRLGRLFDRRQATL